MTTDFQPFVMERMMSKFEQDVQYNLSESGVHPVTLAELIDNLAQEIRREAKKNVFLKMMATKIREKRYLPA